MKRKTSTRKQRNKVSKSSRDAPTLYRVVPVRKTNPIHSFRRAVTRQFAWNPAVGIDGFPYNTLQVTFAPGGINWRIAGTSVYTDAVPNATEFTSLYDQWRLKGVVVRFDASTNIYSNSGIAYATPLVYYIADYDDPNDTTLTDMQQYPQMRVHSFNSGGYSPLILGCKPVPLNTLASAGFLNTFGVGYNDEWLRTAEFSVPHYGLKYAFNANGGTQNTTVTYIQATVWLDFECTNPK